MRISNLVIGITLLVGCREPAPPTQEVQASALPKIAVKTTAKLLLTYATSGGSFETVNRLDKVPEDRRGWVRVVDLSIKPERRADHELVYVADLREKRKDGSYPYVVMSRAAYEAAAVGGARAGATAPAAAVPKSGSPAVILYATAWCPACRSAREYMRENGIPFVEKDIEKDQSAATELLEKARRAGISATGVPVLDVRGTLMQGFNPERLRALLGDKK
jgi:glutaredoxin